MALYTYKLSLYIYNTSIYLLYIFCAVDRYGNSYNNMYNNIYYLLLPASAQWRRPGTSVFNFTGEDLKREKSAPPRSKQGKYS